MGMTGAKYAGQVDWNGPNIALNTVTCECGATYQSDTKIWTGPPYSIVGVTKDPCHFCGCHHRGREFRTIRVETTYSYSSTTGGDPSGWTAEELQEFIEKLQAAYGAGFVAAEELRGWTGFRREDAHTGGFAGQDRARPGGDRQTYTPPLQPDHWSTVLGVTIDDPLDVVKKRYRQLANQHHPDRGGSKEMMSKINKAWTEAQASFRG